MVNPQTPALCWKPASSSSWAPSPVSLLSPRGHQKGKGCKWQGCVLRCRIENLVYKGNYIKAKLKGPFFPCSVPIKPHPVFSALLLLHHLFPFPSCPGYMQALVQPQSPINFLGFLSNLASLSRVRHWYRPRLTLHQRF